MTFLVKRTHDTAFIAGAIYFIQGFLGISGIALPLYLRHLGWSISDIAVMTSITAFPWIFKILYGMVSDSYAIFGSRRKFYLIFFSVLSAFGWFLLAMIPTERSWIFFAMSLTNLGFAAVDVVTDGYVVEHSTSITSSIYQSIAWGSRSAGSVFSGLLSGWLAAHWPARDIFFMTMLLPLIVCFFAVLIREKKFERPASQTPWFYPILKSSQIIFSSSLKYYALILFLAALSSSFGVPLFFHMRETLGFPEPYLGLLTSLGWGGAGLGSIFYMRWLRKISPARTLRIAILINSINILSSLLIADTKTAFIIIFIGGAMGCLVMLPIASSVAAVGHQSGVEGTLFAVLMTIFNVGQIIFGFLGGKLFNVVGLVPLIIIAGMTALLGLFVAAKIPLKETKAV